jgi:glycerophosphoryl diester phosphodiesterase
MKKEFKLIKQIESIDIELLLLPEIIQWQKYFKKNYKRKRTNLYMRGIKGSYKKHKMPTDPEKRRVYVISQNMKNLEKLRKKDPKEFKLRRLLYYSRVRAKQKGLEHSITKEWLDEKTKENKCELTNIEYNYDTTIQRNPYGPSIDRIDVSKGYTPNNCRVVIWAVNAGLGHYSEKDLYIICKEYLKVLDKSN